jgi:AcrR family transcriptional regulator
MSDSATSLQKPPRPARPNAKREALVAACAELFWTRGFAQTSLSDIAATSGVPLGNIYYYFRSKGDMADAVADIFVAETDGLLDEVSATTTEPRDRLALLARRLSAKTPSRLRHGCPIAACVRAFRIDAPSASVRAAEAFGLLIGYIARELGRTGMRPSSAMALARGAINEWQGGIILAHALQDATIASESTRRLERLLIGPQER